MHDIIDVRVFKEDDHPKIRELILSILTKEYPFDKSCYSDSDLYSLGETYGGKRDSFFVIEKDSRIIGTAAVKEESDNMALLRRVFVDPEFRGKGYGKLLVDRAVDFCKQNGYNHIVFRTTNRMIQAIQLCKKKGFKEAESADLGGFKIYKFLLEI